jgi:polyhydroxyalkanoate synthesis regulator phasin
MRFGRVRRPPVRSKRKSFRLRSTLHDMYPPHVSDQEIKHVIRELTVEERLPSGAQLRAVLRARFGSRGGVSRIYRLLANARVVQKRVVPSEPGDVGKLEREVESLRKAVQLAEYREQAHQSRWAMEVDRLRQQVAGLEPLALKTKAAMDTAELLRHQLHAAHVRIAALEQEVLDAAGSSGRG